jgi:hypothetical protein
MLLITEAALKGMDRGEFMDMCAGLYGRLNVQYAGNQA